MGACFGKEVGEDAKASSSAGKGASVVDASKPPFQCEGYPPAILPKDLTRNEQVDFYLTYQDASDQKPRRLACSLVRCLDNVAGSPKPSLVPDVDRSKPVIILCHGFLSWRNQMVLAYLSANLSKKLRCHTLRFDFSGNAHSAGTWHYGNYEGEARDLTQVIKFVRETLKCRVSCLVGHSKGTHSILRQAWEQEGGATTIPCFVNLSGPFAVPGEYDLASRFTKEQIAVLNDKGEFLLETRGQRRFVVTQTDIEQRANLDSSPARNIKSAHVLTIHGDADDIVDVSSAHRFAKAIPKSNHELLIIKGADHNLNGLKHMDELTATISKFISKYA